MNILTFYRLYKYKQEIRPILNQYKGSENKIYMVIPNKLEKLIFDTEFNKYHPNVTTVILDDFLNGGLDYMKGQFDYIVEDSAYSETEQVHQNIFNLSADLLKNNGQLEFIQPA